MATDPPQGEVRTVELTAEPISAQAFAPYGTLIEAIADGQLFGPSEAQLALTAGTPRLYIMELPRRALQVRLLTRHRAVTQCLASAGGKEWFIVVAPPDGLNDPSAEPNIGMVRGFRIPGDVAVKMHRGTSHLSPYGFPGSIIGSDRAPATSSMRCATSRSTSISANSSRSSDLRAAASRRCSG
jgi:ureidoglycolate lyase